MLLSNNISKYNHITLGKCKGPSAKKNKLANDCSNVHRFSNDKMKETHKKWQIIMKKSGTVFMIRWQRTRCKTTTNGSVFKVEDNIVIVGDFLSFKCFCYGWTRPIVQIESFKKMLFPIPQRHFLQLERCFLVLSKVSFYGTMFNMQVYYDAVRPTRMDWLAVNSGNTGHSLSARLHRCTIPKTRLNML